MQADLDVLLMDGEFTPADAKALVFSFIDHKINYHNLEVFSMQERKPGADVSRSRRRVEQLRAARKDLEFFLEKAARQNERIHLHSVIQLQLLTDSGSSLPDRS